MTSTFEADRSSRKIIGEIERSKDELTALLRDLVRIPTINPPGERYTECATFLARWSREAGLSVKLVEVPDAELKRRGGHELPRTSVISTLGAKGGKNEDDSGRSTMGGKNKRLHINGHYDVVPVGPGWTTDPFGGSVSDGRMYGRGTTDMKGGVAAALFAAMALARTELQLGGELVVSATPDEETGGDLGAGFIVENGFVQGDSAIVAEGGQVDEISLAHKGALWCEVKTIGKPAHGSMPQFGVNAVTNMARVVLALDGLATRLRERRIASSQLFSVTPSPVLTAGGVIKGGVKVNVVPAESTCTVDRRLMPEESAEEAEQEIGMTARQTASLDPEVRIETRRLTLVPSSVCPRESAVVQSLSDSLTQVNGAPPRLMGTSGFTDAHYFSKLMPTAMYGPSIVEKAHQIDEYVVLDHVCRAAKVYALTALDFLGREE